MAKPKKRNKQTVCCFRCGSDTNNASGTCSRCLGNVPHEARAGHWPDDSLEDDYGDESGPDDVCDDNAMDPHGKWSHRE